MTTPEEHDGIEHPQVLTMTDSGEDETTCPICFAGSNTVIACGPCQHGFCLPCVERVLLDSPRHEPHPEDAHLAAPTLGRCPICRAELNMFDLQDRQTGECMYTKESEIHSSPLAGSVYVLRNRGLRDPVGHESIHFPNDESDIKLPYLNLEVTQPKLDDGSLAPSKMYFETGCFYHSPTRTFHGSIVWSKSAEQPTTTLLKGSNRWDFRLQFSADLRLISRGIIIKWRESLSSSSSPSNNDPQYPLDGRWSVTWKMAGGAETTGHIDVIGNVIELGPYHYVLDLQNKRQPRFEWPLEYTSGRNDQPTIQTAQSGVDLVERPQGPAIGESIVWTTTDPIHVQIIWKRETIGALPPPVVVPLGPPRGKIYQRQSTGSNDGCIPIHHPQGLWGNTFCQGLKVGLASYQFKSPDDGGSYISYEHPLCGQWPPLDDGSPVPSRVPFRNVHFDVDQKIFRGTIEWAQDYGVSWQGMSRWIYEMHFDSEYTCIVSGTVRSVNRHHHEEEMSKFGENLIYVNAGMSDTFRALLVTSAQQQTTTITTYELFSRLSRELRHRLMREGASVRTMAMLHHVFVSALHEDDDEDGGSRSSNPIDYNL